MKVTIENRLDLYTGNGQYLGSVMKGGDGNWRLVQMHRSGEGQERIARIQMLSPDTLNLMGQNIFNW